jgi:hypothetical protein
VNKCDLWVRHRDLHLNPILKKKEIGEINSIV